MAQGLVSTQSFGGIQLKAGLSIAVNIGDPSVPNGVILAIVGDVDDSGDIIDCLQVTGLGVGTPFALTGYTFVSTTDPSTLVIQTWTWM